MTIDEFIQKANQIHDNKYDYSRTVYVDSRTKVIIVCPIHGAFEQRPTSHLSGNGCPGCAKEWTDEHRRNLQASSRASRGMTTEEWVERAKVVHGGKYDYSQTVYVNKRTDVKIICPKHGMFTQKADSHIRGFGCRLCGLESEKRNFNHKWSDEQRAKIAATCRERYGADRYLDSEEGKQKVAEIKAAPEFRSKMSSIISSEEVQEKTRLTCLIRYGVEVPMMLSDTRDKVDNTKRKNGTWSTSKPEEDMYVILCDKFGAGDVYRQYKDARYPFHCDFYIKSLDLFIELNATWLHGGHWFNELDVQDVNVLNAWKQKCESGKRFYDVAIRVWTISDVQKREVAMKNNLNYVVFWKNDLSDFKEWIQSESLQLCNIK